jgi:hypothetical protein
MRHQFFLAAFAALSVLATGCNNGPGQVGQGNYGTIFGTVTSSVTGKAIAGATVTVSVVVSANTDANGLYRITGVPVDSPGLSETVTASAAGYHNPPPKSVSVKAGQQYQIDFQLQPAP